MRILISNDDGILAPGLAALYHAVADMGEVTVVAPDSPQSAAGHSITLSHPLAVRRVHVGAGADFHGISVDGRPADCVRLAIRNLLPQPPDIVLSGVNAGANVGINVFYSGTVAAAAEGAMMGIPSVAFSAAMTSGEADFARAAKLCRWVLDRLLTSGLGKGELINVNIPELGRITDGGRNAGETPATRSGPLGVRVVPQSTAGIDDEYVRDVNLGGECYRLGEKYGFFHHEGESDVTALAEGYITVTPLHVDMTRHSRLAKLKGLAWDAVPNDE
jgi:5'-nucleotidase